MKLDLKMRSIYLALGVANGLLRFVPFFAVRRKILQLFSAEVAATATIHRGVKIFARGRLTIGPNSVVNNSCYLDNRAGIQIGENVSIAHSVRIYTMGHDIHSPDFAAVGRGVVIEDFAVLFANVLVMPGVTIGEGAVVYAGSVVSRDVPPLAVVAGNPAGVIKTRSPEALAYTLNYSYWLAP